MLGMNVSPGEFGVLKNLSSGVTGFFVTIDKTGVT